MRKFLYEMETEITESELREYYEKEKHGECEDYGTFGEYLKNCMFWWNGALTEILTAETPKELRRRAVSYMRAVYSDDADDSCWMWLTYDDIRRYLANDIRVMPFIGERK